MCVCVCVCVLRVNLPTVIVLHMPQGYLGDVLSQQCGLVVVGLEREEDRVMAARNRTRTQTKATVTEMEPAQRRPSKVCC